MALLKKLFGKEEQEKEQEKKELTDYLNSIDMEKYQDLRFNVEPEREEFVPGAEMDNNTKQMLLDTHNDWDNNGINDDEEYERCCR